MGGRSWTSHIRSSGLRSAPPREGVPREEHDEHGDAGSLHPEQPPRAPPGARSRFDDVGDAEEEERDRSDGRCRAGAPKDRVEEKAGANEGEQSGFERVGSDAEAGGKGVHSTHDTSRPPLASSRKTIELA